MPTKYTTMREVTQQRGRACPYCQRPMRSNAPGQEPTRDHTVPQSKGGLHTIWACWTCNNVKGDMLPDEWTAFMLANPEWWIGRVRQHVRLSFRDTVAFLRGDVAKASEGFPFEYEDPMEQRAFEHAYRGRLWMLRF